MKQFRNKLKLLKDCIWGNRFNLSKEEQCKFDNILLFVLHSIEFKNDKQKEKFINDVLGL